MRVCCVLCAQLLQSHYCVAYGVAHDDGGSLSDFGFTVRAAVTTPSFAAPPVM